jgi:hypothetical protein
VPAAIHPHRAYSGRMSTFRNPVGPQAPAVYWRRRLLVALCLVAVIVVIVLIIVKPGSGTPTGGTGGSNPTPTSTVSTDPDDVAACDPAKITVEAVTNAVAYDPGVNPELQLVLKSTATTACTIQAGSDVQVFTITSGDEVIWKSTDCQVDPKEQLQLLNPGVPVSTPSLTWDRTRSSPDTCDQPRDQVTAGGASYHLAVAIGDIESETTKQFILN